MPHRAPHLLVFELAGQAYALPLAAVREIVFRPELSRPAGLPSLLQGFFALGTELVPVLSLRRLLGLPEGEPGRYTPVLVLPGPHHPLALAVDALIDMAPADALTVDPHASVNGCVSGHAQLGERPVSVLDPPRLLLEQEVAGLAELHATEAARRAAWTA
ncbi:MAG TPA: chemotaxis protein CheW [Candidatus Xenobia bacterium]|jgi:purine-binding chemotaxis protein CheW